MQRLPRMMQLVMRVAAALLFAVPAAAQQGGAVTVITTLPNHATAQFTDHAGVLVTARDSADIAVIVRVGARLTRSGEAVLAPGAQVVFPHLLENTGERDDRYALTTALPAGWLARIHADVDGDGQLGAGDTLTSVLTVARGASLPLLLHVTVPADAGDSTAVQVRVTAASRLAPAATAEAVDLVTVRLPRSQLTLFMTADRETAAHGDTVAYTLTVRNLGNAISDTVTVVDTLPAAVEYVAGTLRLGGQLVRDSAVVAPVAAGTEERRVLRVSGQPLEPGGSHAITFAVVLRTGGSTKTLDNAAVVYDGASLAGRATADVRLAIAELDIQKSIVGDTLVPLGGQLTYRLAYTNKSSVVTAREVILSDSLPDELELVSAEGEHTVTGRTVEWLLEPLGPGQAGSRDLIVRAVRIPAEGNIVNNAAINALNAVASSATSSRVVVSRAPGSFLGVAKAAGVLEARLGEAVPYTIKVTNRSVLPLSDIVVHDLLPAGMQLAGRRVIGADSMALDGRSIRMYVSGPLAPGGEHTLRYNGVLVSGARSNTATNVATATADRGRILADSAVVTIRIRRGFELENRTLVGKVWVDRNDDGRQDPGELGVAGIEIWSADGARVATDREGRFSLRDVRPGQHTLRLDMLKVPAGLRLPSQGADLVVVRSDGWTLPQVEFRLVPAPGAPDCICPDTAPRVSQAAMRPAPAARGTLTPGGSAPDTAFDRSALLIGPAARFIAPTASSVIHANRIYVGVRGEANMPVRLYDGDSLLAETFLRADGQQDFIGVALAPGPHTLRVWTRNSWGNERWDSLAVHRSGTASSFHIEGEPPVLHPETRAERPVRIRVLDRWKQPVAPGMQVSLESSSLVIEATDTDRSSIGLQRKVGEDGWLELPVRGGPATGAAAITLRAGSAREAVMLRVLPLIRPMTVMGAGEVGVGAALPAYGVVTARGAVSDRTVVSISYDSRRDDEDEPFARAVDPLQAAQYPTLGDGSRERSSGMASGALTARVEREYDWLEFGDVTPRGIGGSGKLFNYHRALTGVQGRLHRGVFSAQGFGTLTRQQLVDRQIRATRGSGPYEVGAALRPGTERVLLEVRARENTSRVVSSHTLARTADYDLDYATGALLLRQPVAEIDVEGNPVFIVVYVERLGGGDTKLVGGGRTELSIGQWIARGVLDSVSVGATGIHDASGVAGGVGRASTGSLTAIGGDTRLLRGGFALELEHMRTARPDTTAGASRVALTWTDRRDRLSAAAQWLGVEQGFGTGLDPRLSSGLQELRLAAGYRVSTDSRVELAHERQLFHQYDVQRQSTFLRAQQQLGRNRVGQELGVTRDAIPSALGVNPSTVGRGKLTVATGDRTSLWLEGSRNIGVSLRPSAERLGMGAGYRLFGRTRVEGTHFLNSAPGLGDWTTTGLALRTETLLGGRAWGGVERASAGRSAHSALMGIEQRIPLAHGWEVHSMYERRMGLASAPLQDAGRALPFPQQEPDRSVLALGVSLLPGGDRPNVVLRGERHQGAAQRGLRVAMAGDASFGPDAALLARSDWSQFTHTFGGVSTSRNDRSLLGYAFRPTRRNDLNLLAKAEWRRSRNPLGSSTLSDSAELRRLIGTTDAVWTPMPRTELAARYAMRWSEWRQDGLGTPGSPIAHYSGVRAERGVAGRVSARLDGRLLLEQSSGVTTWSVAPSLLYRLNQELRLEAGYRAGTLQDVDFGMGTGRLFATLGLQFTERSLAKPAQFWRERLANDR